MIREVLSPDSEMLVSSAAVSIKVRPESHQSFLEHNNIRLTDLPREDDLALATG